MTMRTIAAALAAFMLLASAGCDAMLPKPTPTPAPTASPTPTPTPLPDYLEGSAGDDALAAAEGDMQTTVPDWFPTDVLPLLPDARVLSVSDESEYISVTYATDDGAASVQAFYRENAADWDSVNEYAGDGALTIMGEHDGQTFAVTVSQYADEPTSVSMAAYYTRDIEQNGRPETSEGSRTPKPEGTPEPTREAQGTPEPTQDGEAEATP